MKKILLILLLLVIVAFGTIRVSAEDETGPIEEIPTEEVEDIGFFENIVNGFFDFATSEEFTKICTSLSVLGLAIYPFIKNHLSAKAQAKYNRLVNDAANYKQVAEQYKQLVNNYAKAADSAFKNMQAIKDSLILGFDKSNLRQDTKDKILNRLNSVPKIENIEIIEDEQITLQDKKDNLLTEGVQDEPKEEESIETPIPNNIGW